MTIRYRDSSVDSNIPGTSLDQGGYFLMSKLNYSRRGLKTHAIPRLESRTDCQRCDSPAPLMVLNGGIFFPQRRLNLSCCCDLQTRLSVSTVRHLMNWS